MATNKINKITNNKSSKHQDAHANVITHFQKKIKLLWAALTCFIVAITCFLTLTDICKNTDPTSMWQNIEYSSGQWVYAIMVLSIALCVASIIIWFANAVFSIIYHHFYK